MAESAGKRKPSNALEENKKKSKVDPTVTFKNACVAFYALKNSHNHYFVPSKTACTFGGIAYEFVMVDSGCNTLLLPLPPIESLNKSFGTKFYEWSLSESSGVGGESKTLIIQSVTNNVPIKCKILSENFSLPRLRFHIPSSLALQLKECPKIASLPSANQLSKYAKSGLKERNHVLLGQGILQEYHFVQTGSVTMFIRKIVDWNLKCSFNELVPLLLDEGRLSIASWKKEFDDLKDEDHDGDDYCFTNDYDYDGY